MAGEWLLSSERLSSSTTIPQGKHRFSSDHRSYTLSGEVSTRMGDRLGIPGVVDSFLFVLKIIFWSVIFNFSVVSKRLLKLFRPN